MGHGQFDAGVNGLISSSHFAAYLTELCVFWLLFTNEDTLQVMFFTGLEMNACKLANASDFDNL